MTGVQTCALPIYNTGTEAAVKSNDSRKPVSKHVEKIKAHPVQVQGQKKVNKEDEPDKVVDEEILQKSVEQANKSLELYNRVIERSVHDVTHTVMYTVRDSVTNEDIQEFPPKKIQDMIAKMWELAGLFVDEKA